MNIAENLNMDTVDNKFIMMARIAVTYRKLGHFASVGMLGNFATLTVQDPEKELIVIENISSSFITEDELLAMWEELEAGI